MTIQQVMKEHWNQARLHEGEKGDRRGTSSEVEPRNTEMEGEEQIKDDPKISTTPQWMD